MTTQQENRCMKIPQQQAPAFIKHFSARFLQRRHVRSRMNKASRHMSRPTKVLRGTTANRDFSHSVLPWSDAGVVSKDTFAKSVVKVVVVTEETVVVAEVADVRNFSQQASITC